MTVGEGQFQLYERIAPDLPAGDWRIQADQRLIDGDTAGEVGDVATSNVHFRVNSPRYVLPPGQVLSTFPPANAVGSFGSRLPQVVLKRRTLPWERLVDDDRTDTPWMALVVFVEGEAEFVPGEAAADCFTDGVDLPGGDDLSDPEVGTANCLEIRKSMVDKIFPTQEEVDALAHAREVDINDTELAMGDDDGFLSVVVGNRLPLPGVGPDGEEQPLTYLACLVNLEGQFDQLLETTPDPVFVVPLVVLEHTIINNSMVSDHYVMQTATPSQEVGVQLGIAEQVEGIELAVNPNAAALDGSVARTTDVTAAALGANTSRSGGGSWAEVRSADQIYADMAAGFTQSGPAASVIGTVHDGETVQRVDPLLRFPVLLHWSFTTSGQTTFESLMKGLDSRLLGDSSQEPTRPDGRLPLEVAETGHAGLTHRTRDGDEVRAWYRGPLAPHPMDNKRAARLPLAHAADQLRVVTPDHREDLSLAAGFEVGRLLALSQPSIVASLLRWRQDAFRAARLTAIRDASLGLFDQLGVTDQLAELDVLLGGWGVQLGRQFAHRIAELPDDFLGAPRPILTPGRPLDVDGVPTDLLATGLGIGVDVLRGQPDRVFENLRATDVPLVELDLESIDSVVLRDGLQTPIDSTIVDIGTDVLADGLVFDAVTGPAYGAIGVPSLVGVEVGDYLTAVLDGDFSLIEGGVIDGVLLGRDVVIDGGIIVDGGVVDGGVIDGGVIDGGIVDGGVIGPLSRSVGRRVGGGGRPLARRPSPTDDHDGSDDR